MNFENYLEKEGISEDMYGTMTSEIQKVWMKKHENFEKNQLKIQNEELLVKAGELVKSEIEKSTKGLQSEITTLKEELSESKKVKGKSTRKKEDGIHFQVEKFVEERKKAENKRVDKEFVLKIAAGITTGNLLSEITDHNPLQREFVEPGIGSAPKNPNLISMAIDSSFIAAARIITHVDRVNEEGDAVYVAEAAVFPLVDAESKAVQIKPEKLGIIYQMTEEILEDAEAMTDNFTEHFEELVEKVYNSTIITGDGISPIPNGLENLASAYIPPAALIDIHPAGTSNLYDVMQAVITSIKLANFMPEQVRLNPVHEALLKALKATDENYIMPSFADLTTNMISGIPIIYDNDIPDAKILVGELMRFKSRITRNITHRITDSNADEFTKDLITGKITMRNANYLRPNDVPAIVYEDIATIQSSITAA